MPSDVLGWEDTTYISPESSQIGLTWVVGYSAKEMTWTLHESQVTKDQKVGRKKTKETAHIQRLKRHENVMHDPELEPLKN